MKCWLRSSGPRSSLPFAALVRQRSALSARGLVAVNRQQTLILSSGSIHLRPAADLRPYSTASPSPPPSPSSSTPEPPPPSPPASEPNDASPTPPPAAAPEHKEVQDEQQQQPQQHEQQPDAPPTPDEGTGGLIKLVVPPVRPFRWPIFTPIKVNLMLNYLEHKDPGFKRDEFLEGAKSAFSALMVRFPPEPKLVEQLRDAIEPGLYKAMVEGGETYLKNPLRVDLQLEQLDSAEIVNVHILNKPDEAEQKESADDAETFRQQPETVHVEVKFDCKEQVTTKVVVENKPDQIISQDQVSRSHEWVFEGTIRPGSSPLWRLVMI